MNLLVLTLNRSALTFRFQTSRGLAGRRKTVYIASYWLRQIEEDKVSFVYLCVTIMLRNGFKKTTIKIPIFASESEQYILHNYLPPDIDVTTLPYKITKVAELEVVISFRDGLDEVHKTIHAADPHQEGVIDAWDV